MIFTKESKKEKSILKNMKRDGKISLVVLATEVVIMTITVLQNAVLAMVQGKIKLSQMVYNGKNKDRMIMKEKINKILWDFAQNKLTHNEATQQVLDLFAVVGQSEQLKCGVLGGVCPYETGDRLCRAEFKCENQVAF